MLGPHRTRLSLAATIALLGVVTQLLPPIRTFDVNVALDGLFRIRGPTPHPEDVVVVSVDSESASALGLRPDPDRWPRALHGELVSRLNAADASVIVFDLIFAVETRATDDLAFASAVAEAGNVILLERLSPESVASGSPDDDLYIEHRKLPIPSLRSAALATAPFPLPLEPVKVSQFWAFGPSDSEIATLPAISLHEFLSDARYRLSQLIAEVRPELDHDSTISGNGPRARSGTSAARLRRLFLTDAALAEDLRAELQAGSSTLVEDPDFSAQRAQIESLIALYAGPDSYYLNLYGPVRSIRTLPYHTILADDWDATTADLSGKVVFIGFSEPAPSEQLDDFPTAFSQGTGARMSGVEIGATAFANLLSMNTVRILPPVAESLVLLVWGFAFAALLFWLPVRWALAAGGLAATFYLGSALLSFSMSHLFLPISVPIAIQVTAAALLMLAWRYRTARSQRDVANRTLGLYLPPQVIDELAHSSRHVRPQSRLLFGTCLVTDAAQYTTLSERMTPEALHRLLNEYYDVLFAEIERFGGFVADIIGDSMVAVWANPEPDAAARTNVCRASRALLIAVDRFNSEHSGYELPTRIGIHSGQVLLADVGAQARFEYRAVGDIVNTATRIQELNKLLQTRELISGDVLTGTGIVSSRMVGDFLLPGKRNVVRLFDSVTLTIDRGPEQEDLTSRFEQALTKFRTRNWQHATREFEALSQAFPDDGPSRFYLTLCRRYSVEPPGEEWDGTVIVKDKYL